MSDQDPNSSAAPLTRRQVLTSGAASLAASALVVTLERAAQAETAPAPLTPAAEPKSAFNGTAHNYQPVVVPNGAKLPWKWVDGVKVFHLVAEEVEHEFAPGLKATCWGYNGHVHGPAIEVVEGDRVRFYVSNRLPAATTVHWHGILLPNGMDGVGGLNQKAIQPGETFKYEFTIRQNGMGMYHAHHDEMTQMGLGMTGLFIMHPRRPQGPRVDRDFALMLHEWKVNPGAKRPDPNEMVEFNLLTINGKVYPATDPLVVEKGQRVRIRIGNLSAMDHHPIHLHGYRFHITETDGGVIPESARMLETTVLVPVGSTKTVEFVADEPGDWAMHCHMTHHVMNQMGHNIPNMIGVKPSKLGAKSDRLLPGYMSMGETGMGDMADMGMAVPENSIPMLGGHGKYDIITMGGMFTILKVRDRLHGYADPGWYEAPQGTLAQVAPSTDLSRDGIDVNAPPRGLADAKVRFG
jgi:FtsP/CotA-like multicopper oxidase with cupredoxin domain